jgi:putative pyoverdin transport system ATP-binding/permease protein
MALFAHLLRSSRRTFLAAIATSLLSGSSGAAFIVVVNMTLSHPGPASAVLVWAYVALCLTTIVTRFVSQTMLFRLAQETICQLRRRLIDAILRSPLRSVERMGAPALYSALSDDVVTIADALPGLPAVCSSFAFVLVALVYLAVVSPVGAIAALAATAVGVVVYRLFSGYGLRSLTSARREQDRLFEHFRAATEGIKELKLNRQRRAVMAGQELDATAASYRRHSVVGLSIFEGASGGGQAVFFLLIGMMLYVLPAQFALTRTTLVDSVLVVLFAVSSVQGILILLPPLGRATVALRTISDRLELLEPAGQELQPDPAVDFADWSWIEFRHVSHLYPGPAGEEFVLGPLNLEFRRGEVMFMVGANGSGKTTLAKVLTGLYPPESGAVWVDGTEVTGQNRDAYRQLFSAVFADFYLFDSLLGLPAEDLAAKARHHLHCLQLDHRVSITSDRFSTTALSQGQRKRLALLTSYLEDRPFVVFDEWAADQDPMFKEFFYRELLAELKARNKSVLVITHDDRYFHVADRLIRLDYGQILKEENRHGPTVAAGPGAETAR